MTDRDKDKPDESGAGPSIGLTNMIGAQLDALLADAEPLTSDQRLGAYRIVDTIGRGGMGTVFLAERDDQRFQHRVAIKVVSGVAVKPETLARFRSERQILAKLEHPYIAHLVDGGETESGLPFLVMEFVEGEPIMDACRERNLDIDQRLDLFLKVCEAVQFAHQNLIVHRDLKPGNILVTADGFPKLLDFGIAKILDPRQFDQTMIETQDGQRLLTPDHAAPEQVLGRPVTTATDVYCLGILLYELLAGRRPYTVEGSRPGELERIICEVPPSAPSTLVGQMAREGAADGDAPPLPPERLRRRLRGDLDNIVLKALRKEPERRYVSVAGLAEDLRRHRKGLPVSARPDTWGYRTSKFVKRNTLGVGAAATLVTLLTAFAITATVQSRRIQKENRDQQQITAFIVDLFENADPNIDPDTDITIEDALKPAAERIESELDGQPDVQATIGNIVGVMTKRLGNYDEAAPLLEAALTRRRALGEQSEELMGNQIDLGEVLIEQARYQEAEPLLRDALSFGQRHFDGDHHEISRAHNGLGRLLMAKQDYAAAEQMFREALEFDRRLLGPDDPALAHSINAYAMILWRTNDLDGARRYGEESLALRRRLLGNKHTDTVESVNNLAAVLIDAGDHERAGRLFREAVAMNEHILGPQHPTVGLNLNNLGYVLLTMGQLRDAEPVYRRALEIDRKALGNDHPDLSYSLNSLAQTLTGVGRYDEAETHFAAALEVMAKQSDFEHRLTGQVLANYAVMLNHVGRHDEAYDRAVTAKTKIDAEYPEEHWRRAFAASVLGGALAALGRTDEARPLLEGSVESIVGGIGVDSVYAQNARARLAALNGAP